MKWPLLILQNIVHSHWHRRMSFGGGETTYAAFYFALGVDSDGARTTALHLRRRGWKALLEETVAWLERKTILVKDGDLQNPTSETTYISGSRDSSKETEH